ncbi:MAG TPA: zf-HC2 domain-containing protein [Pyrinomonadaceae bacterium]|nr:zf-HC2 domain-containing protein [Pyrinomonadaceae bacterium]
MMCSQTEKVSLLIDGELPHAEALQVSRHLHECAECHEAHESFLLLRGQLTSYQSVIDAKAVDAALAGILSRRHAEPTRAFVSATNWRERFANAFGLGHGFSPRFAAAAALIVLAVGIGIIVLLLPRQHTNVAINSGVKAPAVRDALPVEEPQKPQQTQKAGGKSGPTIPNKEEARPKPAQTPTRHAPRTPRRRTETAPNYSEIEGNVALNTRPLGNVEVELMTARHLEQSEVLLRTFRNVRPAIAGQSPDIYYERQRAQKLLYQNMLVRREADAKGDVQVATLLGSLEPILLDIANLRNKPGTEEVVAIKERVERKNLVPLLQINSAAVARAYK